MFILNENAFVSEDLCLVSKQECVPAHSLLKSLLIFFNVASLLFIIFNLTPFFCLQM